MRFPAFPGRASLVVFLWCLAVVGAAATALSAHYPIADWLVWRYAVLAGWTTVFLLSCLAGGHVVVRRLSRGQWPFLEELLQSLAIGALLWGLLVFSFGLAGALYPYLFALLPLLFLGVGLPGLIPRVRHFAKVARRWRVAPRASALLLLSWAALAVGVALLYALILSPKALAYDAHWYHVAVAEQWAGVHAITRSSDGSSLASRPHLANWLYTWAFLWPQSSLWARIELALHLEFGLFLATLAAIPIALRTLLPRRRLWTGAAAALLLFPGIYVYDSTISGGADHILAFYALPVFLAWRRAYRAWSRRNCVALALLLAAAFLVKYQAVYFAAGIGVSFLVSATKSAVLRDRATLRRLGRGVLVMFVVGLVTTAPVWLTNAIWYGNPIFPFLVHLFPSHPWGPDVIDLPDYHDARWVGTGSLGHRLATSLWATLVFSFQSNDWPIFHGEWPVYGFLFSLLFPLAFFLKDARRAVPLVLMSLLGIFVWHFTYRQVRYLQALTPWLALVVACVLATGWRQGVIAKIGLSAVLLLQVFWGSDHPFLPSHAMVGGGTPFPFLLSLAASGYTHRWDIRNEVDADLPQLSAALPPGAKVLLHDRHVILGLEKDSIVDAAGIQSALSYRRFPSPRALYDALAAMGVTHVHWHPSSQGWDHPSSDLVFYDFAKHYLVDPRPADGGTVARMPSQPPTGDARYLRVGLARCNGVEIFTPIDLDTLLEGKGQPAPLREAASPALWVVDTACGPQPLPPGLVPVGSRGNWQFQAAPPR